MAKTYTDYPESATNNAKRAIKIKEENDIGCGTKVGWTRARQLANREAITLETVRRMASFNRHRQNSKGNPKEDCGALMWLAWGGTSGINWAIKKSESEKSMKTYTKAEELFKQLEEIENPQSEADFILNEMVRLSDNSNNPVVGIIENADNGVYDVRVMAQAGDNYEPTDIVLYRFAEELEKFRETPDTNNEQTIEEDEDTNEISEQSGDEDGDTSDQSEDTASRDGEGSEDGEENVSEQEGEGEEREETEEEEVDDKEFESEEEEEVEEDSEEKEFPEEDEEEDEEDLEKGMHEEDEEEIIEKEEDEEEEDDEMENPFPKRKRGMTVSWMSRKGRVFGKLLDDNGTVEVYVKENGHYVPTTIIVKHNPSDLDLYHFDMAQKTHTLLCELKEMNMDVDEKENVAVIKGIASSYGNVDLGGDTIARGAYKQTLYHKNNKVKLFTDHDWKMKGLIGLAYLKDSDEGLMMNAELPLDIPDASDTYKKIKFMLDRDEKVGLSIGYTPVKSNNNDDGTRTINEVSLEEISVTPFPMDTHANILEARIKRIQYKCMQKDWSTINDAP